MSVFPRALLLRRVVLVCLAGLLATTALTAQSLAGSAESMARQNEVAQENNYSYLRTPDDVRQAYDSGDLVSVSANEDLELAFEEVSFPVARPQVRSFLEQLGHSYHEACGEALVVTSLTRPITRQPWNASPISVHPTGMAVDLRRSDRHNCRQWLERTLLSLEDEGIIEATLEHIPPHYHVAVFPDPVLLPGPIGDPNGIAKLVALHEMSAAEMADLAVADRGVVRTSVHLSRSRKTGRLQITQTAIAHRRHHSAHPATRSAVNHGKRSTSHKAVPAVRRAHHGKSAKSKTVRASLSPASVAPTAPAVAAAR